MRNDIFIIILLIIGISLIYLTHDLDSKTQNCKNVKILNMIRWLIIIATIFVTLSVSYGICKGNCGKFKYTNQIDYLWLVICSFALGVQLIIIGSILIDESKTDDECLDVVNNAWGVIIGGVSIVVLCLVYFSYRAGIFKKKQMVGGVEMESIFRR